MNNHPSRATDYLLGKMWKTKSARFNAQARLRSRHWASVAATSLLSLYLVGASLAQLTFDVALQPMNKLLSLGNVIVSVFLIIVTLLETAKNYQGDADRMHQSALNISELYNRFQALTVEKANEERLSYNDRYSEALKTIPVDHKTIDYTLFMLRSSADLKLAPARKAMLTLKYAWLWLCEYSLYLTLILVPPLGLTLALLSQ